MQKDDREMADYTSARGSCIYSSNATQILQDLFRILRRFKSIDFTVHIYMEPGCIETFFGLKLVILGRNCSSRELPKVSRISGGILEVFSTSPEFGRKSEIREAVGALIEILRYSNIAILEYWDVGIQIYCNTDILKYRDKEEKKIKQYRQQ